MWCLCQGLGGRDRPMPLTFVILEQVQDDEIVEKPLSQQPSRHRADFIGHIGARQSDRQIGLKIADL